MARFLVMPLKARRPNEVDKLLQQAKRIQALCDHNFRLLEEPSLTESKVAGVYIANNAEGRTGIFSLKLRCLNCSIEKISNIASTCPWCLSAMGEYGIEGREKYFGHNYQYYAAKVRGCEASCGFKAVSDVWDQ
jgi:hypothetical protein